MSFITNIPYRNQQNILKNFDANLARKGKILREITSGSKVNSLRDRSTIFTKGPGSSMVGEVYEVENKARAKIATDVMNNFNKIYREIEYNHEISRQCRMIFAAVDSGDTSTLNGRLYEYRVYMGNSRGWFGGRDATNDTKIGQASSINGVMPTAQEFKTLSIRVVTEGNVPNYNAGGFDGKNSDDIRKWMWNGIQRSIENEKKLEAMMLEVFDIARAQLGVTEKNATEEAWIQEIKGETIAYEKILHSMIDAKEFIRVNNSINEQLDLIKNTINSINSDADMSSAKTAIAGYLNKIEALMQKGTTLTATKSIGGVNNGITSGDAFTTLEFDAGNFGTFSFKWRNMYNSLVFGSDILNRLGMSYDTSGLGASEPQDTATAAEKTNYSKYSKQAIIDRIDAYKLFNNNGLKVIHDVLSGFHGRRVIDGALNQGETTILLRRDFSMRDLMYETLRKNDAYIQQNSTRAIALYLKQMLAPIKGIYVRIKDNIFNSDEIKRPSLKYSFDNNEFMASSLEGMTSVVHSLLTNSYYHDRKFFTDDYNTLLSYTVQILDQSCTSIWGRIDVKTALNNTFDYAHAGNLLRLDQHYLDFVNPMANTIFSKNAINPKYDTVINRLIKLTGKGENGTEAKSTYKCHEFAAKIKLGDDNAPDRPLANFVTNVSHNSRLDINEYNKELIVSMKDILKYQSITELTMTANEKIREQYSGIQRLINRIDDERDEKNAASYQKEFNKILDHIDQIQKHLKFFDLKIFDPDGDYYKKIDFEIFGFKSMGYTLQNHSADYIFNENEKDTAIKDDFNGFLDVIEEYKESAQNGINVSDYNEKILIGTYNNLHAVDSILFKKSEGIATIIASYEDIDVEEELTKLQETETFEAVNDFVFSSIREDLKKMVAMVRI